MRKLALGASVLAGMAILIGLGCNAILGNEPGTLASDASPSSSCPSNEKSCGASCVSLDDPKLGCSGPCTVCPTPQNAQPGCTLQNGAQTCGLGACNAQFGDCDNDTSSGCETHTTTRANCGACGSDCLAEFCERQGTNYNCSPTCDSPNIICGPDAGLECVDPTTDDSNCGSCGNDCSVQNGVGSCVNGACSISCSTSFFLCTGQCVLPTQNQCGASCTPCTAPALCDSIAGSGTYGNCISPADSGTPCQTHICGTTCCRNNSDICCPGSPTQCTPEGDLACGAACDNCTASSETCNTSTHACNGACTAPGQCSRGDGTCGCGSPADCFTANFSSNATCGSCTNACNPGSCCCASDGGYACTGTLSGGVAIGNLTCNCF